MGNTLHFYKTTGAGNDFVVINLLDAGNAEVVNSKVRNRKKFVSTLCNRATGVGADGVVFLEQDSTLDFKWDFYNSDGSSAEMCGNAARCMGAIINKIDTQKKEAHFMTKAGKVSAAPNPDNTVSVTMPARLVRADKKTISIGKTRVSGAVINTGVPHFVVLKKAKDFSKFKTVAQKIRSHRVFGKQGSNVTLIDVTGPSKAQSITFERGVEDYTIACGTGATAAALAMFYDQIIKGKEIKISVPGGNLFISQDKKSKKIIMRGPAKIVYEGELNVGDFL